MFVLYKNIVVLCSIVMCYVVYRCIVYYCVVRTDDTFIKLLFLHVAIRWLKMAILKNKIYLSCKMYILMLL